MNADELFEQAKLLTALETMARMLAAYYQAMLDVGIANDVAVSLVRDYQITMLKAIGVTGAQKQGE